MTMKRIYDWDARYQLRNLTAADLRALKGKQKLARFSTVLLRM